MGTPLLLAALVEEVLRSMRCEGMGPTCHTPAERTWFILAGLTAAVVGLAIRALVNRRR